MAYYYTIKGWVEVEPDSYLAIKNRLKEQKEKFIGDPVAQLYLRGWVWNEYEINWTRFIFYGANVTQQGVEMFVEIIKELVAMNLSISGYFQIQGEDEEDSLVYKINEDTILSVREKI